MKFIWLLLPKGDWEYKKKFVTTALESGIDHIVDFSNDIDKIKKLGNIKVISNRENADIFLIGKNGEGMVHCLFLVMLKNLKILQLLRVLRKREKLLLHM